MMKRIVIWVGVALLAGVSKGASYEWTGLGDGASWDDQANWSSQLVPTNTDTAVFASYVTAPLTVTMTENSRANLIRVTTANKISLSGVIRSSDLEMASGSTRLEFASALVFDCAMTVTVAEGAQVDIPTCSGTGDLTKLGPGKLTFINNSGGGYERLGATYLEAGTIDLNTHQRYPLGDPIIIGGGTETATLRWPFANNWARDSFKSPYPTIHVKTNGVFDLSANEQYGALRTLATVIIDQGGKYIAGGDLTLSGQDTTNLVFRGEVISKEKSRFSCGSGQVVVPADRTSAFVWDGQWKMCPHWSGTYGRMIVEDIPNVAIDATINGAFGNGDTKNAWEKLGGGVLRLTANGNNYGGGYFNNSVEALTKISAGTVLLDNTSGSATGKGRTVVQKSGTLGGVGFFGGHAEALKFGVTIGGNADSYATIHPGTIDGTNGTHIAGTLTAGSLETACPAVFNDRSRLQISVCANGAVDCFAVKGAVTVSGADTCLSVSADGIEAADARSGTYTILSATEGITGDFTSIVKPRGWRIAKVMEADVCTALTLTVPGGLMMYLY